MSRQMKGLHKIRGFTLIEMLTVLVIFSLLALMSYRGLGTVLDARKHVSSETEKWRRATGFFARFNRDLQLAAPMPKRTASGIEPAWRSNPGNSADGSFGVSTLPQLEFSRFAAVDGMDRAQRLAYTLNQKHEIELWLWPSIDLAPGVLPERYPVLSGVEKFELKYLGTDLSWVDIWPLPGSNQAIPRAVQMRIVFVSGEEIVRVFAL
jgi:general secretion pathway protein J